jgi:hypothetical protein
MLAGLLGKLSRLSPRESKAWLTARAAKVIARSRRTTRLLSPRGSSVSANGSKNHAHMMAIYFMHYNFVRIRQTLRVTPAMAAGVTGKLWEMADMVEVLEEWESRQ